MPRSFLFRFYDAFLCAWVLLISGMVCTGGVVLRVPGAKLDLSSVDAWVAGFVLLWVAGKKIFGAQGSFRVENWGRRFLDTVLADLSGKRSIALLGAVFALLFAAHFLRHRGLFTAEYDLQVLHQALYWPWGSPPLKSDLSIQGTYLGEHLAWTLFLLTPLTAWIHCDELIFAIQALCLCLPLMAALKWGPLRKCPALWLPIAMVFLCERALRNAVVWDFREDVLAYAFAFGMLLGLQARRAVFYFGFLLLFICSKENLAVLGAAMAVPILWDQDLQLTRRQRARWALATGVLSVAWLFAEFHWVIPHFSGRLEGANQIVSRFPGMGNTPQQVLAHIFFSPKAWVLLGRRLLGCANLKYLLLVLGPVILLIRKRPLWLVPAAPGIAMNLLSSSATQRMLQFHYELCFLPFLFWGALGGASHLQLARPEARRLWAGILLLGLGVSGRWPVSSLTQNLPSTGAWTQSAYLRGLPDLGRTAADAQVLAQISRFREVARDSEVPGELQACARVIDSSSLRSRIPDAGQRGWREVSLDPSGRFSFWSRCP